MSRQIRPKVAVFQQNIKIVIKYNNKKAFNTLSFAAEKIYNICCVCVCCLCICLSFLRISFVAYICFYTNFSIFLVFLYSFLGRGQSACRAVQLRDGSCLVTHTPCGLSSSFHCIYAT